MWWVVGAVLGIPLLAFSVLVAVEAWRMAKERRDPSSRNVGGENSRERVGEKISHIVRNADTGEVTSRS